jgi:type IV pilus assembly protein PilC
LARLASAGYNELESIHAKTFSTSSSEGLIMLIFGQVPLKSLIEFTRALRHNLGAGLTLRRVMRQQAERGPLPIRPIASRISDEIEQGTSFEDALDKEKSSFPPIFVSLTTVGEQTGNLPEILAELEKYFSLQLKLRRDFISQMAWPVIELVLAILVIALMIMVLAILGSNADPLGWGLTGTKGAVLWLVYSFGSIGLLVGAYYLVTRTFKHKATVDRLLLRLPIIGPCLQSIALNRFCLALGLTMESGMGIASALRLSMRATSNAAYESQTERVRTAVKGGEDLAEALARSDVFPRDFLDIVATAEEGGRVPEVMRHQADYYEEESRRWMTILTRATSWGLYLCIALFIIFLIVRIYGGYIQQINNAAG